MAGALQRDGRDDHRQPARHARQHVHPHALGEEEAVPGRLVDRVRTSERAALACDGSLEVRARAGQPSRSATGRMSPLAASTMSGPMGKELL